MGRLHSIPILGVCIALLLGGCNAGAGQSSEKSAIRDIPFRNAAVHDPSVIRTDDGKFYVFGSHLQAARSDDLMNWTLINSGVFDANKLIPNVTQEMAEAFEWGQTNTFWAGDMIRLPDGKYYMYYSVCKGDSPRAAIGLAVSDNIEGPFHNEGLIVKSGMWGEPSEDGTIYDATKHPNAIDPNMFFDQEGTLWMVYGSYSGGIFILRMDPATGRPLPNQGYGKKLLGGNHSRIEGPYILYSPDTDYYYLFLSFGGLDANGGYNLRVARSRQPNGPYLDAEGHDMMEAHGAEGSFFDDRAIEPYGVKLIGNFQFDRLADESDAPAGKGPGYVSPGHNSAYYDAATKRYFILFHTRFPSRGETYEIRVHQMWLNEDGWPVLAPHRYAGETIGKYSKKEAAGDYKFIGHGKDISPQIRRPIQITLSPGGTVSGGKSGTWTLRGSHEAELVIDGIRYRGVFVRQWDPGTQTDVMTFSALSGKGEAIWGSHVVRSS